jgi:hypothetical protein
VKFILDFDISYENVMMKIFVCTLTDEALDCFEYCSLWETSSFVILIKVFRKH